MYLGRCLVCRIVTWWGYWDEDSFFFIKLQVRVKYKRMHGVENIMNFLSISILFLPDLLFTSSHLYTSNELLDSHQASCSHLEMALISIAIRFRGNRYLIIRKSHILAYPYSGSFYSFNYFIMLFEVRRRQVEEWLRL